MRNGSVSFVVGLAGLAAYPTPVFSQTTESLSYHIVAVADMEQDELRARARIQVPAVLWSSSEVQLDLLSAGVDSLGSPRLRIESLSADVPIEVEEDSVVLHVRLQAPAKPGAAIELDVRFTAGFSDGIQGLLGYHSFWSHEPGAYWYPDVIPGDGERVRFKDFDVTVEFPEAYTLLTSGAQVGPTQRQREMVRARFRANHVEGFSISFGRGFETQEIAGDGYRVVGLLPPDDLERFRQVVTFTAEAVEWYRKTYGFFPVEQIGIIPGPRRWGGGFPLPNVFMIHRANLDPDFLRWITAHELGHYYWGLYVLSASTERLDWLNLANGIWIDHLYLARTAGLTLEEQWRTPGTGDAFIDYLQAVLENREQRLGLSREAEGSLGFDYNSRIRHSKAAIGVYLQARRLGPERFLDLQRQLLKDYRFRPLAVSEFAQRLEAAGARGARDFYERWMRGDARLEFDVSQVESRRMADGWQHLVRVSRVGTIPYDIDVGVEDASGGHFVHTLPADGFVDSTTQTLELTMSAPLRRVYLDPDGALPMWNSSHPGIQRLYIEAMYRAHLTEPLLPLAADYLREHPEDDVVRLTLGSRLLSLGRHDEVVATFSPIVGGAAGQVVGTCESRARCRMAIGLARALAALGRAEEAESILSAIREAAVSVGLERRWEDAVGELRQARTGGTMPSGRP